MNEYRTGIKTGSKSLGQYSSNTIKSDHLTKLNLDIGSVVEVSSK